MGERLTRLIGVKCPMCGTDLMQTELNIYPTRLDQYRATLVGAVWCPGKLCTCPTCQKVHSMDCEYNDLPLHERIEKREKAGL